MSFSAGIKWEHRRIDHKTRNRVLNAWVSLVPRIETEFVPHLADLVGAKWDNPDVLFNLITAIDESKTRVDESFDLERIIQLNSDLVWASRIEAENLARLYKSGPHIGRAVEMVAAQVGKPWFHEALQAASKEFEGNNVWPPVGTELARLHETKRIDSLLGAAQRLGADPYTVWRQAERTGKLLRLDEYIQQLLSLPHESAQRFLEVCEQSPYGVVGDLSFSLSHARDVSDIMRLMDALHDGSPKLQRTLRLAFDIDLAQSISGDRANEIHDFFDLAIQLATNGRNDALDRLVDLLNPSLRDRSKAPDRPFAPLPHSCWRVYLKAFHSIRDAPAPFFDSLVQYVDSVERYSLEKGQHSGEGLDVLSRVFEVLNGPEDLRLLARTAHELETPRDCVRLMAVLLTSDSDETMRRTNAAVSRLASSPAIAPHLLKLLRMHIGKTNAASLGVLLRVCGELEKDDAERVFSYIAERPSYVHGLVEDVSRLGLADEGVARRVGEILEATTNLVGSARRRPADVLEERQVIPGDVIASRHEDRQVPVQTERPYAPDKSQPVFVRQKPHPSRWSRFKRPLRRVTAAATLAGSLFGLTASTAGERAFESPGSASVTQAEDQPVEKVTKHPHIYAKSDAAKRQKLEEVVEQLRLEARGLSHKDAERIATRVNEKDFAGAADAIDHRQRGVTLFSDMRTLAKVYAAGQLQRMSEGNVEAAHNLAWVQGVVGDKGLSGDLRGFADKYVSKKLSAKLQNRAESMAEELIQGL